MIETEKNETLVVQSDELIVAFMDSDFGDKCTRLRIWKSRAEMEAKAPALIELNFSTALRMRLFWLINLQCIVAIWHRVFGLSFYEPHPGDEPAAVVDGEATKKGH